MHVHGVALVRVLDSVVLNMLPLSVVSHTVGLLLALVAASINIVRHQTKTLIDAVAELKLEYPDAIAKVIHGLLTKQEVCGPTSRR